MLFVLTHMGAAPAKSGMVRVVGESAAVERLGGNAQISCADVRCGSLALRPGDAIQASGSQTAIAVSGAVDANGILNVTHSMPTIALTSFDLKSVVVGIKVVPGAGNAIVSTIATGCVHAYGSSRLGEEMQRLEPLEFDLTPYLKAETRGEAARTVDLGTHSFLRVKVAP